MTGARPPVWDKKNRVSSKNLLGVREIGAQSVLRFAGYGDRGIVGARKSCRSTSLRGAGAFTSPGNSCLPQLGASPSVGQRRSTRVRSFAVRNATNGRQTPQVLKIRSGILAIAPVLSPGAEPRAGASPVALGDCHRHFHDLGDLGQWSDGNEVGRRHRGRRRAFLGRLVVGAA
jgi:hypothetical protein